MFIRASVTTPSYMVRSEINCSGFQIVLQEGRLQVIVPRHKTSLLGPWVRRFLLEYLVSERDLARNTQRSYRDTLKLLLPFVEGQRVYLHTSARSNTARSL